MGLLREQLSYELYPSLILAAGAGCTRESKGLSTRQFYRVSMFYREPCAPPTLIFYYSTLHSGISNTLALPQ